MAAIRKLKAMPSNPTRYPLADKSVDLFSLTSRLGDGAIDLLPEVFVEEMQIHILGIGPVFCRRNDIRPSGWRVPLSTCGQRPNTKDSPIQKIPGTVEEIVLRLRTGLYLGEAQNVVARLCHTGDSQILQVIGNSEYPHLVLGEKQSLLIKVDPGNPTARCRPRQHLRFNRRLVRRRATNKLNPSRPQSI